MGRRLIILLSIFLLLAGAFGYVYYQKNRLLPEESKKQLMTLPEDLEKGVNMITQLNQPGSEHKMGSKDVEFLRDLNETSLSRIEEVKKGLEGNLKNIDFLLKRKYPGNKKIGAIGDILKRDESFIEDYDEYVKITAARVASTLGVGKETIIEDTTLMEKMFHSSKQARELRYQLTFVTWYDTFSRSACTTNDPENDPKVPGSITINNVKDLIARADKCVDGEHLAQHQCINAQYMGIVTSKCEYGCREGVCLGETGGISKLGSFDLSTEGQSIRPGSSFELHVRAKNEDGTFAKDFNGNISFHVIGDPSARYSTDPDLALTDGEGHFSFVLSHTDDVTIQINDSQNKANGVFEVFSLSSAGPCPDTYEPVCAKSPAGGVCPEGEECVTYVRTFKNQCELDQEILYSRLHDGACVCHGDNYFCEDSDDSYQVQCSSDMIESHIIHECDLTFEDSCDIDQAAIVQWQVDNANSTYNYYWTSYEFQDLGGVFDEESDKEAIYGSGEDYEATYKTAGKKKMGVQAVNHDGEVISRDVCESGMITKDFTYSSCVPEKHCLGYDQYVIECYPEPSMYLIPKGCTNN